MQDPQALQIRPAGAALLRGTVRLLEHPLWKQRLAVRVPCERPELPRQRANHVPAPHGPRPKAARDGTPPLQLPLYSAILLGLNLQGPARTPPVRQTRLRRLCPVAKQGQAHGNYPHRRVPIDHSGHSNDGRWPACHELGSPLGMNETQLRWRVRIAGPASVTVRPRSRLPLGEERLRRDSGLAAHGPLLERLVGGEDHRPGTPVALTDDLEERVGGGGYRRRARLDLRHPDPVDRPRGFTRDLRHSPVGSSGIQ